MIYKDFFKAFIVSIFLLNLSIAADTSLKDKVAQAMNVNPEQIKFKNQKGGMTSAVNLQFSIDGTKYLVKIFSKKKTKEMRQKEIESVRTFSDLGLGSKLIAVAPDNSFYIREYIPGKVLKFKDTQNEKVLISVAKSMKKLHEFKADIPSRSLLERVQKHFERIKKKGIATPTGFDESFEKFKVFSSKLKNTSAFCHNDLNPQNILISDEGKIYFIDFGNSGMANIYEELGYFTALNGIEGEMLLKFLNAYFGRDPTKEELEAVKLAKKLVYFASACVYFDFSETKKDKKIDIQERIKELNDLLGSNDLPVVLTLIQKRKVPSVKSRNKDLVRQYALACYREFLDLK